MGGQEAAVAGSQGVVFTATDRKIIEERGGRTDRVRNFIDALKDRPLTPEVENEECNARPEQDIHELEGRYREHRRMLKHSALYVPEERVEINSELPDDYQETPPLAFEPETPILTQPSVPAPTPEPAAKKKIIKKTPAKNPRTVEQAETKPAELFDKLNQEQEQKHAIRSKVRTLHLQRLFSNDEDEFKELTAAISRELIASTADSGRPYLEAKLQELTLGTALYKLKLLTSLESMEHDEHHQKTLKWLKKTISRLSKK